MSSTQKNQLVMQVHADWEHLRFRSRQEAEMYTDWVSSEAATAFNQMSQQRFSSGLQLEIPRDTRERMGYNGISAPEQLLRRYPLENFRLARGELAELSPHHHTFQPHL